MADTIGEAEVFTKNHTYIMEKRIGSESISGYRLRL